MVQSNILYGSKSNIEVVEKNIAKLLHNKIQCNDPNKICIVDGDEKITNSNLLHQWKNLTWSVKNLGLKNNDVVALISENSWKQVTCILTSLALGTPAHLLNPNYKLYELKYLLLLSKPKLIYCTNKTIEIILSLKKELDFIEFIVMLDDDYKGGDVLFFNSLVDLNKDVDQYLANFDPIKQTAFIYNSSGTTGMPKGIQVPHAALSKIYVFQMLPDYAVVRPNESQLLFLPIFHGYGTYLIISGLSTSNTTNVILKRFQTVPFYSALATYKVRTICVVPTILNIIACSNLDEKYDVSSLKEIIYSGAPGKNLDNEIVCKKFNIKYVRSLYAMSESVVCICVMPPNEYKKNSIGKLYPDRQLKIAHKKTREALGPNQIGEICVKNPIFTGYLDDPEKNKEVFDEDGFMSTGDAGYYDENGYIYYVDRIKDFIKYNGFQVYPTELEVILHKHEAIKDVAVVSVPDERAGELAVGFVVKKENKEVTATELNDYLSQFVVDYKKLHGGVRFVDSIPKNATGKILRNELREQLLSNTIIN